MHIYSWNVNGIRAAAKKGFGDWLGNLDAELVGLQETRALMDQIPKAVAEPDGWDFHLYAAERKGYSGVGYFSRRPFDRYETSMGEERFDIEGRTQIVEFGALKIVNCYFPNGSGKNRDHSRVPYKLDFYKRLFDMLEEERAAGRPILVMGDWNTAHREIDLARPKSNHKTSGFLPIEREELDRWLESGWTDTFRHVHGDVEGAYTWWSNRAGARGRNVGWRIDYILASPGAMPFLKGAEIHAEVLGSDHCPISVEVDDAIVEAK